MRSLKSILLLPALLLSFAQNGTAQPTVSAMLVNPGGLDVFFLKDFDITRPGSGPTFFNVNINNPGDETTVILRLAIVSRRQGVLSRGRTQPFTLPARQPLMLTNNQLFSNSGPYRLDDYKIDEGIFKDLLADILSTGRLPSDVYTFDVQLLTPDGQPLNNSSDSFDVRVTNPRSLDLIFPGAAASGGRSDCQEIFTSLPQFRWESDMRLFRVIVAEARAGEDPESILNQEPRFVRNYFIQRDPGATIPNLNFADLQGRIEVLPSTTFQYPASGSPLALRPGKTYLWRVIGLIQSSSGLVPLESQIFCFRVPQLDRVTSNFQQLELVLRNLLGPDYDKLFGEGGELYGYQPVRIRFEGKDVTVPELFGKLREGDVESHYQGYHVE